MIFSRGTPGTRIVTGCGDLTLPPGSVSRRVRVGEPFTASATSSVYSVMIVLPDQRVSLAVQVTTTISLAAASISSSDSGSMLVAGTDAAKSPHSSMHASVLIMLQYIRRRAGRHSK